MKFSAQFAAFLARSLELHEREAVLGDLAEARESGISAAWQVLTLAARRQLGLWRSSTTPALAFVLLAPTAVILSAVAGYASHLATIYGWLYLSNWTPEYLTNAGARADLWRYLKVALEFGGAMAAWSWAAGFAAGSLARRAIPGLGLAAAIVLFALQPTNHGVSYGVNDAAFRSLFAGWLLPIFVRGALIVTPAWAGLAQGSRWTVFGAGSPRAGALRLVAFALALAATAWLDWTFRVHRLP